MVRREADGRTLYWIQDEQKVSVTMLEHQYGAVVETQDNQIQAKAENQRRRGNYLTALGNAQLNEDASRPYPNLVQPLMISVTDPIMDEYGNVTAGVISEGPWFPPLPTIKLKN